jgi:hypothetical protein
MVEIENEDLEHEVIGDLQQFQKGVISQLWKCDYHDSEQRYEFGTVKSMELDSQKCAFTEVS